MGPRTVLLLLLGCFTFVLLVTGVTSCHAQIACPGTPRRPPGRRVRCGDDRALCWCVGDFALCEADEEVCPGYIPELPGTVRNLDFHEDLCKPVVVNFTARPNEVNKRRAWTKEFFLNASHITHLFVLSEVQNNVTAEAFSLMKNLSTLCLSALTRELVGFESVVSVLSIPTLREVSVYGGLFEEMSPDVFDGIDVSQSRLEKLRLEDNAIQGTFNLTALLPFEKLKELSLDSNGIREIILDQSIGLTILCINFNNYAFKTFPITCRGDESLFPDLEYLYLAGNTIREISSEVCLPKLVLLDVSFNLLTNIATGTFSDRMFPSLQELIMEGNVNAVRASMVSIKDYAFQNRMLRKLSMARQSMDFRNTVFIRDDAFADCTNLTELFLDNNSFDDVYDSRFLRLFGKLPLINISISASKLDSVSLQTFQHFPDLHSLDLSGNKITAIPHGVFDPLIRLRILDLSHNKITNVNKNTFSVDTQERLTTLRLGRNPFLCSCDLLWFRSWIVSSPLHRHENPRCDNIPRTTVRQFSMNEQACLLSEESSIQIIVTCTTLIVTTTLASLLFRYRWHVRLVLYDIFRGRRDDIRRRRLEAGNFDFDVLVSYASDDLPWVRQHLMPELEDNMGLRLCVHERDFIPGKNIVDNIMDCVDSSKKIMMVFSRDFVRSQWCQFELALCLHHVMDFDDTLIIVCVDDVASRDMTSTMMAVLKTTTYIQWEESEDAVRAFWGRLRLALHEIIEQEDAV